MLAYHFWLAWSTTSSQSFRCTLHLFMMLHLWIKEHDLITKWYDVFTCPRTNYWQSLTSVDSTTGGSFSTVGVSSESVFTFVSTLRLLPWRHRCSRHTKLYNMHIDVLGHTLIPTLKRDCVARGRFKSLMHCRTCSLARELSRRTILPSSRVYLR